MKRLTYILITALLLAGCSNNSTQQIDPRQHLADEEELDDEQKEENEELQKAIEDSEKKKLPTTVFYSDDPHRQYTYDYLYMMYPISSNIPPIGVHRKVSVSYNEYTILEDDTAIYDKDKQIALLPTSNPVPQEIIVDDRNVINNTIGDEKFYSELGLADILTYINNLDVGISENKVYGNLFVPDSAFPDRPYSVEIEWNEDHTPDIIRLIGFGTGVAANGTVFNDFATYEFEYPE